MPLNNLLVSVVVPVVGRETIGINETTEGVATLHFTRQNTADAKRPGATHQIGTMGIELTTEIVGGQVELGLVEEGDDLEVGRGLQELDTRDGALGDKTRAAAGLCAPCDLLTLRVANGGGASGWCPHTPICGGCRVKPCEKKKMLVAHAPSGALMNPV